MPKIEKLLAMATEFKPGSDFKLRGLDAKVSAYSDEHVFFTVPEAAVDPDEIDLVGKRVRDREAESLRQENHRLQEEIRRMLADPYYYEDRRRRDTYERERRRDSYHMMDYAMRTPVLRNPLRTVVMDDMMGPMTKAPGEAPWIDPLMWKEPSQKKR